MKVDLKEYKTVKCDIPKVGDVAFKSNDWREKLPFTIINIEHDNTRSLLNNSLKERYDIYHVYGVNKKEFRKFTFSNGAFITSTKVRKGSKKETQLKQIKL